MPEFAAIDLGTNSCRMLIARPEHRIVVGALPADGAFTVVDGFSRIVRLGEGLAETGALSPSAMDRTIDALKVCAGKISARRPAEIRCVATEACRRAVNGDDFVRRVTRETGLRLEIIPPEREAALTLAGCMPLVGAGHDRAILVDIGGGSTEVQWIEVPKDVSPNADPQDGPARAIDMVSLPFGVVTLAEEFGTGSMPPEIHEEIINRMSAVLEPFAERNGIGDAVAEGRVQMIGTSGTVTTLGAMHLDLPRYDRARVDGLVMDFPRIRALSAKLSELDMAGRRRIPCVGPGRADLMLMGCALLGGIIRTWPVGKLRIADRGIREGLLTEMILGHGKPQSLIDRPTTASVPLSALAAI